MEILTQFANLFLHLDKHILTVVHNYGPWTYLLLFLIIFCETGLVVTPFLPGDSLLFVTGALAASGSLNLQLVIGLLTASAIIGNVVNYGIGHLLAPKIFRKERIHFLKMEHLERTHQFFEKYGGKTIIITRFVPVIRSFAPFLAGVGGMGYARFLAYNVAGAVLWVFSFVLMGYFFGNMPLVKEHFTLAVFAIIIISLLPGLWEYWQK